MTVGELYKALHECALTLYGLGEAGAIAFFILEERYGVTRVDYALERDKPIDPDGLDGIVKDLAAGRPVQYITGRAYFCGHKFHVAEGVLIPRPETEELVRWIVSESRAGWRILDIGTGSGAIAIALAAALPGAVVTATDVARDAIAIAGRNALSAGVDIGLVPNDILDDNGRAELARKGPFDVVVSNPPYIPASETASLHRNVKDHEPAGALFVPDDDPLLFYRHISGFAAGALTVGGRLFFEVHKDFAEGVADILEWNGFSAIEVRRDIHSHKRMVRGVKVDGNG